MQQKEIKYTGITTTPSDYDCPDGDIASMVNLVNENGSLVPVTLPETLFTLKSKQMVLYIHKASNYCNYIVCDTSNVEANNRICYFTDQSTILKEIISIGDKELYQINSIGNTLIILTSQGLLYALFNSGNYEVLGSNPPFPSISFRLKGGVRQTKSFTVKFENKKKYYKEVYDKNANPYVEKVLYLDNPTTSNALYANINPTAESLKSQGLFQYDFMIRYAYKLYDGSLYLSSVPIHINAGNGTPFFMKIDTFRNYESDNGTDNIGKYTYINDVDISMHVLASQLYYQINNTDEIIKERDKWKDLIKEIVFYITPPLCYMDQNYQPLQALTVGEYGFIFPFGGGSIETTFTMSTGYKIDEKELYCKGSYKHYKTGILDYLWKDGTRAIPFLIKANGEDGIFNFRQIASIKLTSINSESQLLPIESGALSNLSNREPMTDASSTDHRRVPRKSFVYNSRLNLINVSIIPQEYPLESCVIYSNGKIEDTDYQYVLKSSIETYSFKAYILIKSSNTNVLIIETSSLPLYSLGKYFFYPDVNAFKVIVERTDSEGSKTYASSKLEKHEYLNAAYTSDLSEVYKADFDISILEGTDRGFYYPNKIYTSEVNNPFTFPDTGVNEIGTGEIIDIRSATKALSQGQFGQFPLYAFTSEGIWALEVSNSGGFSSKQPITRDVCNNPSAITQIDTAVLFTSERGIMLIQGSESICISELLNKKTFDISTLRGYEQLTQMAGLSTDHFEHSNFMEYIKGCNMSYDYTNQRIIVFNKEYSYAYVFSLQTKTWSMIPSNFINTVNSYPDSYIMTKDNTLVNISNAGNENSKAVKGIIITRPLKLDSPDLLKTITQSIHRGVFEKGHIKSVLYGSRDCINFVPITSSTDHTIRSIHGSPYKYFRFAIITELLPGESLSGTSIIFETRQTNKLR